jgi:hypothetical protein
MSKLKEADFYYGAVLSNLLNNHICPALIEGGTDRQIYDFTTDNTEFKLFVKYRSEPIKTKTVNYLSWQFAFSDSDIRELSDYYSQNMNVSLGLVCGDVPMRQSQYAVLHKNELKEQLLQSGKKSITLSIKKGERAFRLSVGGGREKAIQIPSNRLY